MTTPTPFRNEPTIDFTQPGHQATFRAALERVRQRLGRVYPLRIDGHDVSHPQTFASVNPAHPSQVIGRHVIATADDIESAVQAADRAFPSWSAVAPERRADLLFRVADLIRKRRDELSALMVLEVGKAWDEADGETAEAVDLLEWYARQMLRLS